MSPLNIDINWGGYYASKEEDTEQYGIFRLLDFNRDAYHAALFKEKFDTLPSIDELLALSPLICHAPIDVRALLRDRELQLIGKLPLTPESLEGYCDYLGYHGVEKEEIDELVAKLIDFSTEPPLRLCLDIINDELSITERH